MSGAGRKDSTRGQVLPLFALFLIVLIGFTALAVDVSGALAARRFYRSVADGAALAGAQDLQQAGSRSVTSNDRIRARQHAMDTVTEALGITGTLPAACSTATDADVTDACILPGTSYHVSIKAGVYAGQPSPIACAECDSERAVQVGLRNADYNLSFARVLGQSSYNVGVNSVAGLTWGRSYAIVTLRPRAAVGSTYDVRDIRIEGGSVVTVTTGDVATNANMNYSGIGSTLQLDTGFTMDFADPSGVPTWAAPPPAHRIFTYVNDPNYNYPAMSGSRGSAPCGAGLPANCAPTFDDARTSVCAGPDPLSPCTTPALDPAGCGAELTYLQASVYTFMATWDPTHVFCYKPGIYDPASNPRQLIVAQNDVVILMPGAYWFKDPNGGLDVSGKLLGGYRPGGEGVALMFDECGTGSPHCVFTVNAAGSPPGAIALNVGTKFPPGTAGSSASPARDWNNQLVQTSGPASPTPPILMTLLVRKDANCLPVPAYPNPEPSSCNDNNNQTLNLAGGGSLAIEGVQYAPSDNIKITGGSTGTGQVGQIWAWTLFYAGGTQVNQQGAGNVGPGTLRLDSACTAPGTPCIP